jgi:hypothetical protein
MPSKKPIKKPLVFFGETPVRGRRPKAPKQLDLRLEHLLKESEAWLRLLREVWFNPSQPFIELGMGATTLPPMDHLYEAAIEQFRMIEATVEACIETLEKGKQAAKRKYKSVSSSAKSTPASTLKRQGKR